ncbi:MAG TPA: hypothetical protein VIF64_17160 [Pyrinomonadaceae bacterium]
MKSNMMKKRLMGAFLGLCLLVGIGLAASVSTQAQWQNDSWWQREQIRRQRELEREQIRRQREAYRNERRYNDDYRYRNNDYRYGSFDLRQTALNAGYNEGIKEGRKDRNNGERFEYRDERDYQNATIDYSSRLGDRELYRQYFRQGFANGYNDGYRGY